MGFEIPVDNDFATHPKTLYLLNQISDEADCYPLRLWIWASKFAKDGKIKVSVPQLEAALKWKGKKGKLHRALVAAGFIEKRGKAIHDWMKGIGYALMIYEEKKATMRRAYMVKHGILPAESGKKTGDSGDSGNSGGEGGDNTLHAVLEAMARAKIMGRLKTKQEHAEAWITRVGVDEVLRVLKMDEVKALSCFDLEDNYFRKGKQRRRSKSWLEKRKKRKAAP